MVRTTRSTEPVLKVERLTKSFGKTAVLRDVSFELCPGERVALLGPNGVGKTTLIRVLAGLTGSQSGAMTLMGHPIDQPGMRDHLGIVPQEIALYGDLTARENLWTFARLHGLRWREIRRRIAWALAWTGLEHRAGERVETFSGGMKRRINIACGVMHRPRVLVLDEPTVGVDPQSRERIYAMLDQLRAQGMSILMATHQLEDAQSQSDRVVVMDQGRVVAEGTYDDLVNETIGSQRYLQLRLDRRIEQPLRLRTPHGEILGAQGQLDVRSRINDVALQLPPLLAQIEQQGYRVSDVQIHDPSLRDVFLHLTGSELRE